MKMSVKTLLFPLLLVLMLGSVCEMYGQSYYQMGGGLRLGRDWGLTGKYFINSNTAIEANLLSRNYSSNVKLLSINGLYEIYSSLETVADGLAWYYGGGALIGLPSYQNIGVTHNLNKIIIGIHGVVGLDYKFKDAPISITLDWIPSFIISGSGTYSDDQNKSKEPIPSGLVPDYGGIAVRYTF